MPSLSLSTNQCDCRDEEATAGVGDVLIDGIGEVVRQSDEELIARFPAGRDGGLADEAEVGLVVLVANDVDVVLDAVVPVHDGLVDLARDGQGDLAVALRGRS